MQSADGGQEPPRSTGPTSGTIRRRVSRILALPLAVVLVLLGVLAAGLVQDYRNSQDAADAVTLTLAVQDLVHELQTERGVTAAVLGGNESFENELGPARRNVDDELAALQRAAAGSPQEDAIETAVQQLGGLAAVRTGTDNGSAQRQASFDFFTTRIAAFATVDTGLDVSADDELRQGAAGLTALQDLVEAIAQERALLNGVFSAGAFNDDEFVRFAQMRAAKQEATARFTRVATAGQREALDFVTGTGAARLTQYFEDVALSAADGRNIVVNPQSWWSGLTTVLDDLGQLQEHVGSTMQLRAHEVQQNSGYRLAGLVAVVLLCLAGSGYLAVLASTSITRPLAALAAEAEAVADERLSAAVSRAQTGAADEPAPPPPPVQVPARATKEISSVATALDRMQSTAYALATEQVLQRRRTIESLTNLGHRNQNLIRRQLGFITSLEREEMDPSALANLFELDHLATRMRRNAASLLVLVGASSPRQWSTPVPVADVIRAAVSEVEEYRRVTLRRVDDALVNGNTVGAAAHLLSELIENGLTFSPPDADVEVQGRWVEDGYLIAITDQGVGMSDDELARANARLRGEGDFISTPTRFLGHFVVGQLARETSIHVELRPSPLTGVTARVTLPNASMVRPTVMQAPPSTVLADSASAGRLGSGLRALPQYGTPGTPPGGTPPAAPHPAQQPAAARGPVGDHPTPPGIPLHPATPAAPAAHAAAMRPSPERVQPTVFPSAAGDFSGSRTSPGVGPAQVAPPPPQMTEEERTKNGLRKRVPRREPATGGTPVAGHRHQPPAAAAPVPESSPAHIGARLAAFRSGVQRGQDDPQAAGAAPAPAPAAPASPPPAGAPAFSLPPNPPAFPPGRTAFPGGSGAARPAPTGPPPGPPSATPGPLTPPTVTPAPTTPAAGFPATGFPATGFPVTDFPATDFPATGGRASGAHPADPQRTGAHRAGTHKAGASPGTPAPGVPARHGHGEPLSLRERLAGARAAANEQSGEDGKESGRP